jgi:multiple sugar transport system permease protein/putative aldouronate transport system permease protein
LAYKKNLEAEPEYVLSSKNAVSRADKIFYGVNGSLMFIVLAAMLLPLFYLFANSLSNSNAVASGAVTLLPMARNTAGDYVLGISLDGFAAVLKDDSILRGYGNTIFYTLAGTMINMVLTVLAAYPLSRSDMPGKNIFTMLFTFTMIFSGGIIPSYILMRDLHMLNTRWSLLIPGAINVYNLIICRTFFVNSIPKELLEAAQIDGCTNFRFFLRIALPLSKAVLAVLALYYAVAHWNAYFNAFLYIIDQKLYPLQIVLKDILISNPISPEMLEGSAQGSVDMNLVHVIKYAAIIVGCLPIWCVYPFVQKFFVQGVMIGSVKG